MALVLVLLGLVLVVSLTGPVKEFFAIGGHSGEAADGREYTCGMHPWIRMNHPGLCPICHMKLVPVEAANSPREIAISPVISQNIGVRVADVTSGPVTRVIRTVGSVDYDETRVRDVTLKIGGWIEKLAVDSVGQAVREGQPMLEIYSPDLYAAQQEYLNAYKGGPGGAGEAGKWDKDLLESSRKRLENFGISAEQIQELQQAGKASRTMTLRSPYPGLVVTKNVLEGAKVEPGTVLYRVADLSRVWIMVTLYEYQLPFVQVGQTAIMTLSYIPGQKFEGRVAYIYPTLDTQTRQVKVRLEFPNENLLLKPGMFANVEIQSRLARDRVLVPREAVVDTGARQVAFVSLGQGRFERRSVKIGPEAQDGQVVVEEGLKVGEKVVTSGVFLLDSESNLREATAKMTTGELAGAASQPAGPALPEPVAREIVSLTEGYFAVGRDLANDNLAGVPAAARRIASAVDAMLQVSIPGDEHFWHKHMETATIRGKALELVNAKDLAQARESFADLSTAVSTFLKAVGAPAQFGEVWEVHCPMYREGQGGTWWVQPAGTVQNPFYGQAMPQCMDKKGPLPSASGAKQP